MGGAKGTLDQAQPQILGSNQLTIWKIRKRSETWSIKIIISQEYICFMENEYEFTFVLAKMDVWLKIIGFVNFRTLTSWFNPTNHLKISERVPSEWYEGVTQSSSITKQMCGLWSIKIVTFQKYIYFWENECENIFVLN